METKWIEIDENNIEKEAVQEAGCIIKNGGLVAFPTETVYGLGGDALNKESAKKIYAAKGRPSDNPLIVHFFVIMRKFATRITTKLKFVKNRLVHILCLLFRLEIRVWLTDLIWSSAI